MCFQKRSLIWKNKDIGWKDRHVMFQTKTSYNRFYEEIYAWQPKFLAKGKGVVKAISTSMQRHDMKCPIYGQERDDVVISFGIVVGQSTCGPNSWRSMI